MLTKPALLISVMFGSLTGCGAHHEHTGREKVSVLAAASTTDAIEEVAEGFERMNAQVEVKISTGPSNGLAQQIKAGAPVDVFLAANRTWADVVAADGLAARTVDLLTNRMVIIVPQGNPAGIQKPGDLTSNKVTRVAIAGENVPAGIYAEQALRSLNLFDQLQASNRLARGSDVRITLTYVERAEAEAGIVYATDARVSTQVEVVIELDPRTYDAVVYPVVLLKSTAGKPAASKFFEFLQSSEAMAIFERFGFLPLVSEP